MTKRKRTLRERAHRAMRVPHAKFIASTEGKESEFTSGYTWGFVDGWLAGYRAGKKEGKAEAMKACGLGDE